MKIFPAIDLRNGKAVRLFQGDYDQMTVYHDRPLEAALDFQNQGAKYLHVVDLDGAKDGCLVNDQQIREIVTETDLYVEVGGGIREEWQVEGYLSCGVGRIILGTVAVTNFPFLEQMVKQYGSRIAVGVDARDGKVAINGWKEVTDVDSFRFCQRLQDAGVSSVIYTDIARDGSMQGTNVEAYGQLSQIQGLELIASGGIRSVEDLGALRGLVGGAIIGKALYTGSFDLKQALEETEGWK